MPQGMALSVKSAFLKYLFVPLDIFPKIQHNKNISLLKKEHMRGHIIVLIETVKYDSGKIMGGNDI
jgi:hypothetical protein